MPLLSIDGGSDYVSPQPTLSPTPQSDAPSSAAIPPLEIRLLGGFTALVRGVPLRKLRTRQGNRLLALLALAEGKEQERTALLTQLWPDALTEAKAQSSLRRTLTDLRDALGPESDRLLSPTKFTLALDLSKGATVDTREFDREIARRTDANRDRAIERYAGPLMPDLDSFNDNDGMISRERERRQFHYLTAVEDRADQRRMRGETGAAIADLRRLLAVEPTRETASRALMELLSTGMDDRDGAMAEYQRLRRRLAIGDGSKPERETEAVFERIKAESISQLATNTPDVPNNLPHSLTRFIGREKEIGELRRLLRENRLLTLTGTGGAGKTRLAEFVAADAATAYPDGVWEIELAPLSASEPALVARTVAATLGVQDQPGQTSEQSLVASLKGKRLLLLLDNCEHLLDACAQLVAAILAGCKHVTILTTSREPLSLFGEQSYRVPSMSLPDEPRGTSLTAADVVPYEAVRLFADRASQARHDFGLTDDNAPTVARLCRQLDGIPLALELAAARTRTIPLEQMAKRLDDRFGFLTVGDRSAQPRQKTLRALVDWSYDLLNADEQTLLARLSVFAGGWRLAAAHSICGDNTTDEATMQDLLTSLTEKSLLIYSDHSAAPRYGVLETIRQYGAEKLTALGETEAIQCRHRDWYLELTEKTEPKFSGPEQVASLNLIEWEHGNLRTSLNTCAVQGEVMKDTMGETSSDAVKGLRMAGALWRFWEVRGYLTEGREQIDRMLRLRRWAEEESISKGFSPKDGDDTRRNLRDARSAIAKALYGAGALACSQGDYTAAQSFYDESLQIYRSLGPLASIAPCLHGLARIAQKKGDYALAEAHYAESLELYRESGNEKGISDTLYNGANIANNQGNYSLARSGYDECLSLYRKIGNKRGIANTLNSLGDLDSAQGKYAMAHEALEECLCLYRELGSQRGLANTLSSLGNIAYGQGDYALADARYGESVGMYRELGDQWGTANALNYLGNLASVQKNYGRAQAQLDECLSIRREIGDRQGIADALYTLGNIACAQSDYGCARTQLEESLRIYQETDDTLGIAQYLESIAMVFCGEGDLHRALTLWNASQALRESLSALLPPSEQAIQDVEIAKSRMTLGETAFTAAWDRGRAMTWEQAVAFALNE